MVKSLINFPSKEIFRLQNFYLNKSVFLLEKKEIQSIHDLKPFMKYGMPIIYRPNFKFSSKQDACEKIVSALGKDTNVMVRHGNFHLPKEYAFSRKEKKISLQDYFDNYFNKKSGEYHYLGNFQLSHEQLKSLDLDIPILYHRKNMSTNKLWIGEKGCITPLHCDGSDNFTFQLLGVKKWILIPPTCYDNLYINPKAGFAPADFWCSDVDVGNVDINSFPKFRHIEKIEVVLKQGEGLYVPYGWFHYVETIDDSVMINFWINNRGLTPAIFNNTIRAFGFRFQFSIMCKWQKLKKLFFKG